MSLPASTLFCFGFGYSARALAARLGPEFVVRGTGRNPAAPHLLPFGPGKAFDDAWLEGVTHLLVSIPPDAEGDPVLRAAGESLARRARQFTWAGYLSTTGVYGDHGGAEVDETSPLRPSPGRNAWRAAAEAGWRELQQRHGLPLHIFRLAGIYGPGRNALEKVLAGTASRIDKPGHLFSRIHAGDIASVLAASIARPNPGAIYNVCDDEPASSADVTAFAAQLLGLPPPPLISLQEADLSEMAQSFYRDRKRVANRRIRKELGVQLAYPTYREGLGALRAALGQRMLK